VTITSGRPRSPDDHSVWERRPDVIGFGALDGYSAQAVDGPTGEVVASRDEPGAAT